MTEARHVLVVDVGKTNAKLALVDTDALAEVEVMTRPNRVLPGPPYPHADVEGLWSFMLDGIGALHRRHRVDALVVTTHGATGALVDSGGGLALPVLDYEHPGPDELAAAYDAARPGFAETGSPRLPAGLNLGAQLFWQFARFPEETARTAAILTYPQYWTRRLCGVAAVEPTSLGCHTDLWDPRRRDFSALVDRQGWRARMPPVRLAGDVLGPVTAAVAGATGAAARRRRSIAGSTIPTRRCCRTCGRGRRPSRSSRPGPGWSRWRSAPPRRTSIRRATRCSTSMPTVTRCPRRASWAGASGRSSWTAGPRRRPTRTVPRCSRAASACSRRSSRDRGRSPGAPPAGRFPSATSARASARSRSPGTWR